MMFNGPGEHTPSPYHIRLSSATILTGRKAWSSSALDVLNGVYSATPACCMLHWACVPATLAATAGAGRSRRQSSLTTAQPWSSTWHQHQQAAATDQDQDRQPTLRLRQALPPPPQQQQQLQVWPNAWMQGSSWGTRAPLGLQHRLGLVEAAARGQGASWATSEAEGPGAGQGP